ncbi:Threonyl/alanyl tRNA synthetase [Aspergillus oleicola]
MVRLDLLVDALGRASETSGSKNPPTEALYLDNASLHSTNSQILSYRPISSLDDAEKLLARNIPNEDTYALITEKTVFYPQGGGQASDVGVITITPPAAGTSSDGKGEHRETGADGEIFEVLLVRKSSNGSILHFGHLLSPTSTTPAPTWLTPTPSVPVSLQINPQKRNYHSRLHTAGHILGLAMRLLSAELGERKKVKANHFPGEASLEFEGLLYNESKPLIQAKVDEIVSLNLPVRISWWDSEKVERRKDELDMVEGREVGGSGKLRIAEIGELDANPCGGTHVQYTGETGRITIRKIGRNKGVSRVSYEVPVELDS